ncbi:unnamed protein product, partial [Rotaria magnacalcarata]
MNFSPPANSTPKSTRRSHLANQVHLKYVVIHHEEIQYQFYKFLLLKLIKLKKTRTKSTIATKKRILTSSPIPTTTSISKTVVNENPSEQIDDDDQTAATNNLDQESE